MTKTEAIENVKTAYEALSRSPGHGHLLPKLSESIVVLSGEVSKADSRKKMRKANEALSDANHNVYWMELSTGLNAMAEAY